MNKSETPRTNGHAPWKRDDVDRFRGHWIIGSPERLGFELIYWTGARISDAVRLGEGNVDRDGWMTFTQVKTGNPVSVPFDRPLPDFAAGWVDELHQLHLAINSRAERQLTYITTAFGTARSHKAASQWFSERARLAGIIGKTAHGLRKTRTELALEAGASAFQVKAWLGHESDQMVNHYGKQTSRKRALSQTNPEQKSSNFSQIVPTSSKKAM